MKKEIKDYLPFYLGCEVEVINSLGFKDIRVLGYDFFHSLMVSNFFGYLSVKPILRHLSDMTEEEAGNTLRLNYRYEVVEICRSSERFISYRFLYNYGKKSRRSPEKSDFFPVEAKTPGAFKYLLSKHFDLFGLIEAGLAIASPFSIQIVDEIVITTF